MFHSTRDICNMSPQNFLFPQNVRISVLSKNQFYQKITKHPQKCNDLYLSLKKNMMFVIFLRFYLSSWKAGWLVSLRRRARGGRPLYHEWSSCPAVSFNISFALARDFWRGNGRVRACGCVCVCEGGGSRHCFLVDHWKQLLFVASVVSSNEWSKMFTCTYFESRMQRDFFHFFVELTADIHFTLGEKMNLGEVIMH